MYLQMIEYVLHIDLCVLIRLNTFCFVLKCIKYGGVILLYDILIYLILISGYIVLFAVFDVCFSNKTIKNNHHE